MEHLIFFLWELYQKTPETSYDFCLSTLCK